MVDIASLGIKVEQSGIKEADKSLDDLKNSASATEKATKSFENSFNKASSGILNSAQRGKGAFSEFERSMLRAQNQSNRLTEEIKDLLSQTRKVQSDAPKAGNALKDAFALARRFLGPLVAGFSAIEIVRTADQFTNLKGRIDLSTRSIEEADEAWEGLLDVSKETGSQMAGNVAIFQRLSFVRDEIQATTDEMLQFTETVSKLGIVAGAGPEALKNGLTQLGQSLSSEIVRAEEFNSIMENIPAVGVEIAEEFKISTGQLRRLVIEGKVLSEDVFAAILNATEDARRAFEQYPETVGRALNQVKARFAEVIGSIDETTGATEGLIFVIVKAGDVMAIIAGQIQGWVNTFQAFFTGAVAGVIDFAIGVAKTVEDVVNGTIELLNKLPKVELEKVSFGIEFDRDAFIQTAAEDIKKNGQEAAEGFKKSLEGAGDLLGVGADKGSDQKTSATREVSQDYQKLVDLLKDANSEEEKAKKKIDDVIDSLVFKNEQLGRTNEQQAVYNELRRAGVDIDSEAGRQIQILVEEHERLEKQIEKTERQSDKLADTFTGAFEDMITGAESFGDVMKNVLNDIANLILQETVTGPLRDLIKGGISESGAFGGGGGGLFSGIGSLFSGFGGGGGGGGIFSSIASGIGSFLGFADGGDFEVNGTFPRINAGRDTRLVQFAAREGETVSVSTPGNGGGGGQPIINYNIDARGAQTGVEENIKAALVALDKSIERRALNAVNNTMRRDPNFGGRR